jgi:hypothetical protein
LAIGCAVAGSALRLASLLSHGELYGDEAAVALNVATRSYVALTHPLDFGQAAPVPFLWAVRLAAQVGGVNEYALRSLPFAAGIVMLFVLWRVARRLLGDAPAVVATALAAFSPLLISYGAELKQYSTDALVTLWLVWLAIEALQSNAGPRRWAQLAVGGGVALCVSQPAVFTLAGIALAAPLEPRVRGDSGWARRHAAIVLVWLGVFAALYFVSYRAGENDAYLKSAWDGWFLFPNAANLPYRLARALRAALLTPLVTFLPHPWHVDRSAARDTMALFFGVVAVIAFLAGLRSIAKREGPAFAALMAIPYAATFGAAALGLYPPAARLLLFLSPLLFLTYAAAARAAVGIIPAPQPSVRALGYGAAVLLVTAWRYPEALRVALAPERARETRPVVSAMLARGASVPVYVLVPTESCHCVAWIFYSTDWSAPDTARLTWFATRTPVMVTSGSVDGLSATHRGREELLGRSARMRFIENTWHPQAPDSAWVEGEVARVRGAANPVAWIWAADWYPESAVACLLHGIKRRGGRLISAIRGTGAAAWEVRF